VLLGQIMAKITHAGLGLAVGGPPYEYLMPRATTDFVDVTMQNLRYSSGVVICLHHGYRYTGKLLDQPDIPVSLLLGGANQPAQQRLIAHRRDRFG
jgi:hypothetical protein